MSKNLMAALLAAGMVFGLPAAAVAQGSDRPAAQERPGYDHGNRGDPGHYDERSDQADCPYYCNGAR